MLYRRCRGFLEKDRALASKVSPRRPLALRLEDWIDNNIFGVAKQEGWLFAVTYYAVRDPRYQRAEVCWFGVRKEVEESQAYPVSVVRRMASLGGAV